MLRPYQIAALDAVAADLAKGNNRLLLQMATGLGKTTCFSSLIQHAEIKDWQASTGNRRVLVIAHREELIDQAAETFKRLNPGLMVSIEQGQRKANRYADVVVASIQTLAASGCRRLHDLIRFQPFGIVIQDEAHHSTAASYRTVFVHLGFLPAEDASEEEDVDSTISQSEADKLAANLLEWDSMAPKDRLLLGVTATPNRTDAVGLSAVYQSLCFTYPIRKGVEDGYLVPIVPWVVDTSVSLDAVHTNRGDFNQRELADAVNNEHRNGLAVDAWHKYAHQRPTLAFTVDVAHAHDLAAAFQSKGIRAHAVSGETPKDQRRLLLQSFRSGEIDVITNCMILTEGTDLPMTSCILHAKPTKSATLHEQMTGRGLRLHDGKADCVVIDMVDIAKKHSLMTTPCLYGLPPGLSSTKGKSLEQMAQAWEQFVEAHPGLNVEKLGRVAIEQLQVKASTFNIWEVPSLGAFGAGRAMNWVKVSADSFRLQYPWQDGTEVVTVAPDLLGKYAVSCTFRPAVGPVRQRTLIADQPAAIVAADFAERWILAERPDVRRLTDKGAKWRRDPASSRQLSALRFRRIPHAANISKGDAADLLNLARARAGQ